MTYRLIACDLDGTLMDSGGAFSPRVRRALSAAQASGAHVTLATGRSYLSARPFADDLGIATPLVCYQGGLIAEPGGRVLHQVVLRRELAAQVLALAAERGWHATLYRDGHVYVIEMRYPPAFYASMINPEARYVSDWQTLLDRDPDKVLLIAEDSAQTELIYAEMRQHFSASMQIVRSHALFVEANPPGVNKGAGLVWLADYLGVGQAQVMAVGDHDNDVPMLEWAGLGVAVGNASPACRAVADWIAPPLEEDGAAVFGPLRLREQTRRGEREMHCQEDVGEAGYQIPFNVDNIKFLGHDAKLVMAIETGGMYARLIENGFDEEYGAILVHIKGQPARSTRRIIKKLNDELNLPVVVFTDGDPWSYRIFASIAYGAIKSAHLSEHLVTPAARFLGDQPSDIVDYNLSTDKLTDQDIQALRAELTDPRFNTPYWEKQIKLQMDLKKKAEQQAFAGKGLDYVTKTYLPERLSEMGII